MSATIAGVLDRLRPARPDGVLAPADRLDGRTCLITGANSGLGLAIAAELCRRGGRVLMACRTMDQAAHQTVARAGADDRAQLLHLDLARLASIDELRAELRRRGERLDVVVLNAGIVPREARRTVDGFEEGFQVGYLANVALLRGLLADGTLPGRPGTDDTVTARPGDPVDVAHPAGDVGGLRRPRVVVVSSEAHRAAGPVDLDTLGQFRAYGLSRAMAEYSRNKLLLTSYAMELARRLSAGGEVKVAVHALCPGAVNTRIAREAPRWSQPLLGAIFRLLFLSPERGAEPAIFLACSRSLEGCTGLYYHRWSRKPVSPAAADPRRGRELHEASLRLLRQGPP